MTVARMTTWGVGMRRWGGGGTARLNGGEQDRGAPLNHATRPPLTCAGFECNACIPNEGHKLKAGTRRLRLFTGPSQCVSVTRFIGTCPPHPGTRRHASTSHSFLAPHR